MLKALTSLLDKLQDQQEPQALSEQEIQLASAALLVEVAVIDQHFDEREHQQLQLLLASQCQLSAEDAATLIDDAVKASADSASLYDFTQMINRGCDYSQKLTLMKNLWTIAYADGELDKYEEHIIRRIADLIHVSHRDFIMAKIETRGEG